MSETTARLNYGAVDAQDDRARLVRYLERVHELPDVRAYKARSIERLELRAGLSVLDVGCGTGEDALALVSRVTGAGRVMAVDLSRAMLTEVRGKRPAHERTIDTVCASVTALPFPNGQWHRVRADRVLQHVADPARALREMTRVLMPDGVLVVCDTDWDTLVLDHPDRDMTLAVTRARAQSVPSGAIGRELMRHCLDAGLHSVGVEATTLTFRDLTLAVTRARAQSVPSGAIGRELMRHCLDAGLHSVGVEATTLTFRDLTLADAVVGLRRAALDLAESNGAVLDRLADWLMTLEELNNRGRFLCAVSGFAAWGRKPR
jgi:hypothetical protein